MEHHERVGINAPPHSEGLVIVPRLMWGAHTGNWAIMIGFRTRLFQLQAKCSTTELSHYPWLLIQTNTVLPSTLHNPHVYTIPCQATSAELSSQRSLLQPAPTEKDADQSLHSPAYYVNTFFLLVPWLWFQRKKDFTASSYLFYHICPSE